MDWYCEPHCYRDGIIDTGLEDPPSHARHQGQKRVTGVTHDVEPGYEGFQAAFHPFGHARQVTAERDLDHPQGELHLDRHHGQKYRQPEERGSHQEAAILHPVGELKEDRHDSQDEQQGKAVENALDNDGG